VTVGDRFRDLASQNWDSIIDKPYDGAACLHSPARGLDGSRCDAGMARLHTVKPPVKASPCGATRSEMAWPSSGRAVAGKRTRITPSPPAPATNASQPKSLPSVRRIRQGPACLLGERANVVTRCTKGSDDRKVEILVGQKAHGRGLGRTGRDHDVVRDRIGRVAQGGVDVFMRQARVRINKLGFRRPLRQLAKNGLDWNASTPDHGLALEDSGVDLDPVRRHRTRLA
jgi:hypothetical protein